MVRLYHRCTSISRNHIILARQNRRSFRTWVLLALMSVLCWLIVIYFVLGCSRTWVSAARLLLSLGYQELWFTLSTSMPYSGRCGCEMCSGVNCSNHGLDVASSWWLGRCWFWHDSWDWSYLLWMCCGLGWIFFSKWLFDVVLFIALLNWGSLVEEETPDYVKG